MKTASFRINGQIVGARPGETVLEACVRNKIDLSHSCGGFGTCGTCRVVVVQGLEKLSARNEIEAEMAADRTFEDRERLACQTIPFDGLELKANT